MPYREFLAAKLSFKYSECIQNEHAQQEVGWCREAEMTCQEAPELKLAGHGGVQLQPE